MYDEKGLATFQLRRHRRNEPQAFLFAFDLLEPNGADLRREPIEVRKATLASILRKSRNGVRLNEHLEHSRRHPRSGARRRRIGGGDVQLSLLLFIVAVTLCACQNPGRFQAPQVDASNFCVGQC